MISSTILTDMAFVFFTEYIPSQCHFIYIFPNRYQQVQVVEDVVRKPGAIHRARFMASCLYLLKIFLYREQLDADDITYEELCDVEIFAEYVALLHAPYFLQTPLATAAPRIDREFWVNVNNYQALFNFNEIEYEVLEAVKNSILLHLWYLTEQLVVFGLFDDELPTNERKEMAKKLHSIRRPKNIHPGKPKFPVDRMTPNPTLDVFIGPKSWLIFEKLHANGNWLNKDVGDWNEDEEYNRMRHMLRDLKVVIDLAERCVKDVEEYANASKDPARTQRQYSTCCN